MISSSGFRFRLGISQSELGYPTGSTTTSFSFDGRFKSDRRAGPQLSGVVVSDDKPADCKAQSKIPTEIEHEISL